MPITLNCPKCHKPFRVRDESIGGRVRCPSCASILQVPSSLAPSSHFGFEMPPGVEINPAEMTGAHRPMADDVAPTPPSDQDLLLGGPTRPQSMEYGSAGMALPAPPSIKFRGLPPVPTPLPNAPSPGLPTAPVPYTSGSHLDRPSTIAPPGSAINLPKPQSSFIQPAAPNKPASTTEKPPIVSEWAAARGGLTFIQLGLLLWAVPFLGGIGHGIWGYLNPQQAVSNAPGYLGRPELSLWKEIVAAYTLLPMALGLLLLFIGRAKCTSVPDQSTARGLARAATFLTVLGVVAGVAAGAYFLGYLSKYNLPPETGWLCLCVLAPAAILADLFTLLFIAQVGWVAGLPRLLLSVGTFFTVVFVVPAILVATNLFFPVIEPLRETLHQYGSPFANPDKVITRKLLIAGGIVLLYGAFIFVRYSNLAGKAKRAIKAQFEQ